MLQTAIKSRSRRRKDEEIVVDALATLIDSRCDVDCGTNEIATEGHDMHILLPPAIGECPATEPNSGFQIWNIPEGIVRAEERFHTLLPELLGAVPDQWVYVTADGQHQAFTSKDGAEIAAEEAGHLRGQFVVRLVSILERIDDES